MKNQVIRDIATSIERKGPWGFAGQTRPRLMEHTCGNFCNKPVCSDCYEFKYYVPQKVSYFVGKDGLKEVLLKEFGKLQVVEGDLQEIDCCALKNLLLDEFMNLEGEKREAGNFDAVFEAYPHLFKDQDKEMARSIYNQISTHTEPLPNKRIAHTRMPGRAERRLQQCQSIASFGSWELDLATGVTEWSAGACDIYGLPADDKYHTVPQWLAFIHPEDMDQVVAAIAEGNEALANTSFRHRIVTPKGEVRYVHTFAQFEFDDNDEPAYLYGVVHDITDQKASEMALAQSEANLRQITNLVPHAIFAKDTNGNFIFVNDRFAEIYGLTPEELISRNMMDTIPVASEGSFFINEDRQVVESGTQLLKPAHEVTDHNGLKHTFKTIKVPYTVPFTNARAVLGIAEDITEIMRIEQEKDTLLDAVMSRNSDLERFSRLLSHDTRLHVANLAGIAALLDDGDIDCDAKQQLVPHLQAAVTKLDESVRTISELLRAR